MTETRISADPVAELINLLDLERSEVNLFRGDSPDDGMKRVFGGQVIAQALVTAPVHHPPHPPR